jgi:hypothetical protein
MSDAVDVALEPKAEPFTLRAERVELNTSRLVAWLLDQGCTMPSMEVARMNGVRGFRATQPVKAGSLVIHVPRRLIITQDVARASWTGKVITALGGNATEHGYLAAFLLEIKREGGLWKPYVDALPESFPDHPQYFSDEELDLLHGSPTLRMISKRREWLKREYEDVARCFPPVLKFTFDEFAWARCCVASRAYGLLDREGKSASGLVPGGDMLNHTSKPNCRYTGHIANGFTITASEDTQISRSASASPRANCAMSSTSPATAGGPSTRATSCRTCWRRPCRACACPC